MLYKYTAQHRKGFIKKSDKFFFQIKRGKS